MNKLLMAFVMISSSLSFAAVSEDILARHREIVGKDACEAELESQAQEFKLTEDKSLVLIPCVMGAYQGSSMGYISVKSSSEASLTPIIILEKGEGIQGTTWLMEAGYDEKTKILSTFGKGRGIGDCGQSTRSKVIVDQYGGVNVKTIEIRSKEKCDGKMNAWPVVFKQ